MPEAWLSMEMPSAQRILVAGGDQGSDWFYAGHPRTARRSQAPQRCLRRAYLTKITCPVLCYIYAETAEIKSLI